ncbi:sigma 54-interacting transcriptional regulator [Mucilaginibacter sp. SJ]|uniref:sigma 54-interacting transcriptional regulator n=1 Tax=Mucilaginibacter sp. SJ TaxID=3029053 RepID=UPI0023A9F7E9|nr:sigma 54-interacting transcriptional regulator [Mucilaginibacter sp. SJ]WEA01804.1 sigma 54-interacting transcriptional regulator [Mucilaginibacter sp. SJ]
MNNIKHKPASILIVEDEYIVANDLKMMLMKAGRRVCGIAQSYDEAMMLIGEKKPEWVLLDIFLKGEKNGIDIAKELGKTDIGFLYISANSDQAVLEQVKETDPYGFLVKPFREKDLLTMLSIAEHKHKQNLAIAAQQESAIRVKLEKMVARAGNEGWVDIFRAIQPMIPFDVLTVYPQRKRDGQIREFTLIRNSGDEYVLYDAGELMAKIGAQTSDLKKLSFAVPIQQKITAYNGHEFRRLRLDNPYIKLLSDHTGTFSALQVPAGDLFGQPYLLTFHSSKPEAYPQKVTELAGRLAVSLKACLRTLFSVDREEYLPQVKAPGQVANHLTGSGADFEGIIGQSPLLMTVLDKIRIVAPTDSTVLIQGESGTGKERIASCIHKLSYRRAQPYITLNCAALPSSLIESELFGHEKGAFTGAIDKRIGKFEQADKGTIFLDEVGELSLEVQVKLLRVLQEREIERLGGSNTIKVNVRVITATNRNLEKEVAEGRFRLDLYYRLNVFPMVLPPLRERREDIPLLTAHFIKKFNVLMNRSVKGVSAIAADQMARYQWPGNIRELEHLMERNVLLCADEVIQQIDLPVTKEQKNSVITVDGLLTMEEMERNYIINVLNRCNGKISGPGGAAEVLGMPSSTLTSRMGKLGIKKSDVYYSGDQ